MSVINIAKRAGVSVATVSRVINKNPNVMKGTVAKVEAAMAQLSYEPQEPKNRRGPKSFSMTRFKNRAIGFLWTGGLQPGSSMTGELLVKGAVQTLRPMGFNMLIDYMDEKGGDKNLSICDKVDGLLIHGPEPDSETVKILKKIPCVWIFYGGAASWCDRVRPDHRLVGRKAVEYFRKQNCRRICCITSKPSYPDNTFWTERADAFEQFAKLAGMPYCMLGMDYESKGRTDGEAETVEKVMKEFLSLSPQPDGVFVASLQGYRYYEAFNRSGLRIGRDLHMIVGDYDLHTMDLPPGPVTVDIHPEDISRTAVNQLLWRIENRDGALVNIQTEPNLKGVLS